MAFEKGVSGNPNGRPRGIPNKLTMSIKAAVEAALHAEGGVQYLRWLAREEPVAFAALLRAIVPSEVKMALSVVPTIELRSYVRPDGRANTIELAASQSPDRIDAQLVDVVEKEVVAR